MATLCSRWKKSRRSRIHVLVKSLQLQGTGDVILPCLSSEQSNHEQGTQRIAVDWPVDMAPE